MASSHLPSNTSSLTSYLEELDRLDHFQQKVAICRYFKDKGIRDNETNMQPYYTVLGVDAQSSLGLLQDYDDPNILGPFGEGIRSTRGQHFLNL